VPTVRSNPHFFSLFLFLLLLWKAVGSASDLAQEAADVVLLNHNLSQVLVTLQLAKKVLIYFSINYIKKYTPF
jgi:hypothetical protein